MLRAAECLVEAERVWVQVLTGVGQDQWRLRVPEVPEGPGPGPLEVLVRHHIARDLALAVELSGADPEPVEPLEPRRDLAAVAARAAEVVTRAAAGATDEDLLWRRAVAVAVAAHEVSVHRGSVNPLTEDLARTLHDHTAKDHDRWRELGYFGEPLTPVPADVSWRDRFIMSAGRDPHPLWDR
ncbi:hypothetical protein [Pseudonocardia pini]|uniref:hypothetical protein n=1 Tax=Pseudonocardia pini TaxID=2758030 RepID=UPI0015F0045B|nr:hypothetical protein [Pseudonocardia pini]